MEYQDLIENPVPSNEKHAPANPWLHIGTRTADALHHVFTYQIDFFIHRHFMLLGFMFMLGIRLPDWLAVSPHPIGVLIQMLLVGPVGGIMAGYVLSAMARNIGGRLSQPISSDKMRAAVAWTNYPLTIAWMLFVLSYLIVHQFQDPVTQSTIWLGEGFIGWLPILVAALPFLNACAIRLKGIAFALKISLPQAFLVWILTLLLVYTPFIVVGGAYFTIFRTTVSIAQQAGG